MIMKKYLLFFFVAILGSFIPIIVCELFDTPLVHGIFSFDIFLALLLISVKRNLWWQLLYSILAFAFAFCGNSLYSYAYAFFALVLIWTSFGLSEKKIGRIFVISLVSVLAIVANWSLFMEASFSMSLGDLWGVSKFFWWGVILFFLVPLLQLFTILFFSKKILLNREPVVSIKLFAVLVVSCIGIHFAINAIQQRQPILDFPIYSYCEQQLMHGRISRNVYLQKDIKERYPVIESAELKLDSVVPTVVILVESWGVRKDFQLNNLEFEHFDSSKVILKGLYKREASFTQGAEYEDFGVSPKMMLEEPLAETYKKAGFDTWYLHGYDGSFYGRKGVYEKYGFSHLMYRDEFKAIYKNECSYGFEGICDTTIIGFLDSLLKQSKRSFVYWTTLDSHPPYQNQKVPQLDFCKGLDDVECVHAVRLHYALKAISVLANKHPDYRFVIRGDHRPMGSFITTFYHLWVPVIVLN